MSKKSNRVNEAVQREKRRRNRIIAVSVVVILMVTAFALFDWYRQSKTRVFSDGHQTITLNYNMSYAAKLAHETHEGIYSEKVDNGVTTITFNTGAESVEGFIHGDVLTLPEEWDDGHGHGNQLIRK